MIYIYIHIYISYTSQVLDPSGNIEDLHPSAYVSIRQHTSASVSIPIGQHRRGECCCAPPACADVSGHASAVAQPAAPSSILIYQY